ncbi:MAG: DUF192 domain-containing protein [Alphaproteobacteria bacterium]|nr:DUF192 domain-containing protein [Alphaproteobacteria bacterium]MCB9690793.1 DUF192 domain-containing protein [Alphaproteobacteria bacterium]
MLFALLLGCSGHRFPTHTLQVGDQPVLVELAVNTKDRAQGLMHRASLPADDGMLFIYKDSAPRSFWMKDTKIPLSIAFADSTGKIVRIADMQPLVTESTKSVYPAKYALEMNQGWFAAHGIQEGTMITGIPKDAEVNVE